MANTMKVDVFYKNSKVETEKLKKQKLNIKYMKQF